MIIGVTAAFLLSRKKFWGRDMAEVLLSLPLVLPPTLLGYYLLVLIGKWGLRALAPGYLRHIADFHLAGGCAVGDGRFFAAGIQVCRDRLCDS